MGLTFSSQSGHYEDSYGEQRSDAVEDLLRRHTLEREIPADRDPSIGEFLGAFYEMQNEATATEIRRHLVRGRRQYRTVLQKKVDEGGALTPNEVELWDILQ